jgi:hypothetical protein
MLCASVSFSVVIHSCAAYEKALSTAYVLRVAADFQMFMMFPSPEKKVEREESI